MLNKNEGVELARTAQVSEGEALHGMNALWGCTEERKKIGNIVLLHWK